MKRRHKQPSGEDAKGGAPGVFNLLQALLQPLVADEAIVHSAERRAPLLLAPGHPTPIFDSEDRLPPGTPVLLYSPLTKQWVNGFAILELVDDHCYSVRRTWDGRELPGVFTEDQLLADW